MEFSKLRHRVTIQEKAAVTDSFGAEINDWMDVCTVWASVEPLKGREFFVAQKENAETTVQIFIRYRSGISADMRILYCDRVFGINAIIDVEERHIELQLMCRELL